MIVFPNCKINLGLKVLDKRKDGYHNLESVFVPLPWCDAMEIIENKKPSGSKIIFSQSGLKIAGSTENNLCIKAYQLLDEQFKLPSIKMHLHKSIPMGAGLGGGSSDGAFTLKLLNELFSLKLTTLELQKFAAKLGSDCAFFIKNEIAFAQERGEKLKTIKLDLKGLHFIIVYPEIHINTADAFKHVLKSMEKFPLENLTKIKIKSWPKEVKNDFESYAFHTFPQLKKMKDKMYSLGALYAGMSGSGSAIYGVFKAPVKKPKSWEKWMVFESEAM